MKQDHNPFVDGDANARVLAAATVCSGSVRLAEMAGRLGFDVVWIDMEHANKGPRGFPADRKG